MSDSTALGIFRIIAPEFQAVKDEVVEKYLVITEPFVSKSKFGSCLLYTSPSPRDRQKSRMPSSA